MSKMRVYEYAKKQNVSSKDVITKLKDMNIEVSNHMTTIEASAVQKLDGIYGKKEDKQPEKQNQQKTNSVQTKPKALAAGRDEQSEVNKGKNKPMQKQTEGKKPNHENNQKDNKSFNKNKNKNNNNNNQNRNKNNNKGKSNNQVQVPPAPKKVKELPAKITPKSFIVNLQKSLKNYSCLVLWLQLIKRWIKMPLN